jgi:beta-lactamase regulating signal transducer with metallopeptidase domain
VTASANGFVTALVERLGWCLVDSVWQGAAVALVAAGVLRLLKQGSASVRYLTACGALLAMVCVPLVTSASRGLRRESDLNSGIVLSRSVPVKIPAATGNNPSRTFEDVGKQTLAVETDHVQSRIEEPSPSRGFALEPVFPALVGVWAIGVFGFSLRLLGGWIWIQRLVRQGSRPVEDHWLQRSVRLQARMRIGRPVRLLESARLQVPLAVGWLRPVILLPMAALTGLPSDQLEAILAHELAHIGRFDYLVNLVQSLIETLVFYHPAAWWISAQIRAEREHCCDDWAVHVCGDRLTYARALAALEEKRCSGWLLAPSARDGSLLGRIRRLVGATSAVEKPASGLAGTVVLVTIALVAAAIAIAPARNQARAEEEPREAVTGSVETSDGKPVAGADVWLVAHLLTENRAVTFGKDKTDKEGRFRLAVDGARLKTTRNLNFRALWAYKPGTQLATIASRDDQRPLGFDPVRPVRLALGEPTTASFRILDPANKPVAAASVTLTGIDEGFTAPPADLVDRLAARTDQDGRAVLVGTPLSRVRGVRVQSEPFGTQNFYAHLGFKADEPLRLRAVVPVEGRVTADAPAAVRGLHLYLSASPEEARDMTKLISQGEALVVTDGRGRFRVPALTTGQVFAVLEVPEESFYRAPRIDNLEISTAKPAEIVIPLKRMVRVQGVVREKGTGKPLPNIGVIFGSNELTALLPTAVTDQQGHYHAMAPPGPKAQLRVSGPNTYFSPLQGFLSPSGGHELAIGPADGQTLAPVELDRGVTLRGIVVDAEDKPVAGAAVEGKWNQISPVNSPDNPGMAFSQTCSATAKTDEQGRFVLEGIHPGANLMLEASASDSRTERPTQAAAGTATPARLVINSANTVALFGRVVDAADKPVAGALVQIRSRPVKNDGFPDAFPIRFDEGEVRTGSDGWFRIPRQLKRGYGYRAEIKPPSENFMSESSPWLAMKAETKPFLSKIVLRRLRMVRGRVVDSQGRSVAGATVRQAGDGPAPTQTDTDAEGQFALPGVLAEPAFLLVAKDRYRFVGAPIAATDTFMEVRLTGVDEAVAKRSNNQQLAPTRDEELATLHRVFDPYADRVIKEGTASELFEILRILVRIDPGRAIELLSDQRLQPWQPNEIRLTLAKRLVRQDDKEARALIEAIQDTNWRSHAYAEVSFALPDPAMARKLDLLNESLIAARAVVDPGARVERLAEIGGRLFDLGQTEQATKVIQEARPVANKLTRAWERGRLAAKLAQIELPAALKLLEGTGSDPEHDRYLGRFAHEIAGRNPIESERVLMTMRDVWPYFRDEYTQKVCHRMVTIDRDRAFALARGMKNHRYRARALGAMALAIEKTGRDHPAALGLLDEAFHVLDHSVDERKDDWDGLGMACTAAAGILPIVEQVDAERLPEFVWRTLSLRPPIPGPNLREGISDLANARVAAMLARYDRSIARQVLGSFADRALAHRIGLDDWGIMFRGEEVFEAAAIVDPVRAAAMIDSLPEPSGLSLEALKNSARMAVARILARPGEERRRYIEQTLLHLWPIDSEEN